MKNDGQFIVSTTYDPISMISTSLVSFHFDHLRKMQLKILPILLSTTCLSKLIGHVNKVVFSPTLHLSRETSNEVGDSSPQFEDHGSRRCVRKVIMVEEMKFDEVNTCNHSYDKVHHLVIILGVPEKYPHFVVIV